MSDALTVNVTTTPLVVEVERPDSPHIGVEISPGPSVVTVEVPGPQGEQGPPGESPATGDKSYAHQQSVAAAVWTVTHNLGKRPSTTIVDSAGSVCEGDILHDSANQLTLTFSAPFSGFAYLN